MPSSEVVCARSGNKDDVTRVLVIDDSPMMCRAIENILEQDPNIKVTGCAHSGREALEMLQKEPCDICTLDVHMPGMNGITVLKHIMVKFPRPTLMVSAFTADGARITFDALRYGAVDFFQKPSSTGENDLESQGEILRSKIKSAARVQVEAARYLRLKLVGRRERSGREQLSERETVNVIATSTGGYSSLLSLLPSVDAENAGPVLVSMAVGPDVLQAFIDYVSSYCSIPVKRLEDGQVLKPGVVYFMGEGECASFEQKGGNWVMNMSKRQDLPGEEGPVDLTLFSASENFGDNARAIFLSGDDIQGITGSKEILRNGGSVLIQRPATCLSPDVPCRLLNELDGVGGEEVSLSRMASIISGEK